MALHFETPDFDRHLWRFTLPASAKSRAAIGAASVALIVTAIGVASPSFAGAEAGAAPPPTPVVACTQCVWSRDAVRALLAEIAAAGDEGLDPAAYDGAALRTLVEAAGPGPALDKAADKAALTLAGHYLLGRVADRARQNWYIARGDDDPAALAAGLRAALAEGRLQPWLRSLLPGDARYAALRAAYRQLGDGDAGTRARVRDNLERWRWLPRDLGGAHIFVNVPSYTLAVVEGGVPVSTYDVVVGAPATPTPQISAAARTVVVNPAWHVPPSIVRSSNMRAGKPGFVTSTAGGQLSFSQPPGPRNALGRIKIDMPNPDAIYLHDTPAKALFQRTSRAFSHGCIRVKDIDGLAAELVSRDAGDPRRISTALAGYQTTPVRLRSARQVYIVYFTAEVGAGGELVMHDDPYGRDTRLSTTLAKLDLAASGRTPDGVHHADGPPVGQAARVMNSDRDDATAPRDRIVRRLDPRRWEMELCPELADMLRAILTVDAARVIELGYANVKAPELVVALDRRPAARTIAAAWAAGAHPDLVLAEDGIGCRRHYAEIDWTAPLMAVEPRCRWLRILRAVRWPRC